MKLPEVTIEAWPQMVLPRQEIQQTLQYLAHKTQKPVTFRWYTENEGYSDQSVSVQVFVKDDLVATYNPQRVVINGQTHPISSEQRGMASALVQNNWKKIPDEEGQLIGCVDHNRIILPLEITAVDNDAAKGVLAYVLEKALDLLDFDVTGILKEKEEEFCRHFISTFHTSATTRLELRKEELAEKQRGADEAYYRIVDFERERNVLDEEISLLTELAARENTPLARSQAKALMQIQSVGTYSRVTMDAEGTLLATTSAVTIEHDGWEFEMGRYEIQIPSNGDVRIKALDSHPNAGHPHPHVAHDGRPCLGNISGDLAKLVGKMRYAEALQLLHSFLSSYNPENPYEKIGHFDPSGQYADEEEDPCEDCDEKCTPYCIFSCEHNNDMYSCQDCCEYRSAYCYEECEHNSDHERFHPCDDCDSKGGEHCYLKCRYNKEWQLQNPCDDCEEEECLNQRCDYFARKEKLGHVQVNAEA